MISVHETWGDLYFEAYDIAGAFAITLQVTFHGGNLKNLDIVRRRSIQRLCIYLGPKLDFPEPVAWTNKLPRL